MGQISVARRKNTRKILLRNRYRGIGFVILQKYIVTRFILLDKVVFKQERLLIGLHYDVTDVVNLAHKHLCFLRVVLTVEIRTHAPLQVFRFPNINYRARLVEVLIAPRQVGQVANNSF